MILKTNKLRDAITFALIAGMTSVAGTGVAFAQDSEGSTSTTRATELDTITVTGSRIKSQTFTSSSPVTEISAEEFRNFGATTVEDLVNQYPQLDLSFDNFSNNPSFGHATVSMRGLGPQRTLTLVNGRRLPSSRNELADPSIVPAAMIRQVDVLSGGASAVYGADAVAGVVNFILDDRFEGISLNAGWSAYQHNNDNRELQALNEASGFPVPKGNSGSDGISRNADIVLGGSFADNRGHAVGWLTWRENDALFHSQRDYSACSVWYDEAVCGGSGTADPARFSVSEYANGAVRPWPTGTTVPQMIYNGTGYSRGSYLYNYAPANYFQRPDSRTTAGFMGSFEISEHFEPYIEAMFVERRSGVQIAESGSFGVPVVVDCVNPLIGTLCADAGVTTAQTQIQVWKRNVEGGPRRTETDDNTHRIVAGVRGGLFDSSWNYDVSMLFGRTKTVEIGKNDFLISRIAAAALGCDSQRYGTFQGCIPYDVWTDNISEEAAAAMAGTSFGVFKTSYNALAAEASGFLGFGFPSAGGEEIGLAVGMERRQYTYYSEYDSDSAAGNFAGSGASDLPVDASNTVNDFFAEMALPVYVGDGAFNRFDASLGYRYSDDETIGNYDTYKLGLSSTFLDSKLLVRAGYNRAVRAPSLNDLYYTQRIALGGTTDFCAGPAADIDFTPEQCARTGVPIAAYGTVPTSPANQYYALLGGNPSLGTETADTYTVGFAIEPIDNLNLAVDWYNIEISGAIGGVGYNNIQILCMTQNLYCDQINRDARSGQYDLWIGLAADPASGHIVNVPDNLGVFERTGVDLNVSYGFDLGPGRATASLAGTYVIKDYTQALADDPTTGYDCKGLVNNTEICQTPKWRHVASLGYSWDRFSARARWRHVGAMDYLNADGSAVTGVNQIIWLENDVSSYNYLDLSGTIGVGPALITLGVNNVLDKTPPFVGDADGAWDSHANSLPGYDQVGRYLFGSVQLKF